MAAGRAADERGKIIMTIFSLPTLLVSPALSGVSEFLIGI
jgi:hypothetical protein